MKISDKKTLGDYVDALGLITQARIDYEQRNPRAKVIHDTSENERALVNIIFYDVAHANKTSKLNCIRYLFYIFYYMYNQPYTNFEISFDVVENGSVEMTARFDDDNICVINFDHEFGGGHIIKVKYRDVSDETFSEFSLSTSNLESKKRKILRALPLALMSSNTL